MNHIIQQITLFALSPKESKDFEKEQNLSSNTLKLLKRLEENATNARFDLKTHFQKKGLEDKKQILAYYASASKLSEEFVQNPPLWVKTLDEVLEDLEFLAKEKYAFLDNFDKEEIESYQLENRGWPIFAACLHPFIFFVEKKLATFSLYKKNFSKDAKHYAHRYLLTQLSKLCARTFTYELKKSNYSTYEEFMESLSSIENFRSLLLKYPLIARFISELMSNHINNIELFLSHLDKHSLCTCKVDKLCMGLSDPHNDSKTVIKFIFEDGRKLIYKPRSQEVDKAYEKFIEWFNEQENSLPMKTQSIVASGSEYGFLEYIEEDINTREDVLKSLHVRQGQNLAIMSLLNGSDVHFENIIIQNEQPIIIDLEAIFQPSNINDTIPIKFQNPSNLNKSGLLPDWLQSHDDGKIYENSGIFGSRTSKSFVKKPLWRDTYTKKMSLTYEYAKQKKAPYNATLYYEEILKGFTCSYEIFEKNKDFLLSEDSPLKGFKDCNMRMLLRNTKDYYEFLLWSSAPDLLQRGSDYDLSLELLFMRKDALSDLLGLNEDEKSVMWKRDIPIYYISPKHRNIKAATKTLSNVLQSSLYEQVKSNILHLSKDNIEWYTSYLKATFALQEHHKKDYVENSPDALLRYATYIGDTLLKTAIKTENKVTWMEFHPVSNTSKMINHSIAPIWLYSGTLGISLYLANLFAVTKDSRYKNYAIDSLRWCMESIGVYKIAKAIMPLSTYNGVIGVVYVLLEFARLFKEDSYKLQAKEYIKDIDLKSDTMMDFLNGMPSIIPILVKLELYEEAKELSYKTLELCQNSPISTLGLAHGRLGIAYALSCYYKVDEDPLILEYIKESLTYERSHFDTTCQDWPDTRRKGKEPFFMLGWCAGAPGHGLARIGILKNIPSLHVKKEIITAANTALKNARKTTSDHLCCGKASLIWFLSDMAQYLEEESYQKEALKIAQEMIKSYQKKNFWHLQSLNENEIIPSLFGGTSGIGLSFLKLLEPRNVSNVVLV